MGLEPTTLRLRVSCSTDWASRALMDKACFSWKLILLFLNGTKDPYIWVLQVRLLYIEFFAHGRSLSFALKLSFLVLIQARVALSVAATIPPILKTFLDNSGRAQIRTGSGLFCSPPSSSTSWSSWPSPSATRTTRASTSASASCTSSSSPSTWSSASSWAWRPSCPSSRRTSPILDCFRFTDLLWDRGS